MSDHTSLRESRRWERHEGLTCVECPSCGFRMDEDHEDMEGGYSCPNCQVTALYTALRRIAFFTFDVNRSAVSDLAEVKQIATDAIREQVHGGN